VIPEAVRKIIEAVRLSRGCESVLEAVIVIVEG
jgi:hypothetical protein